MKIGNIELKNKLILAPMAGVSDVGFRHLCVLSGADYAVSEMTSAKALKFNNEKTKDILITSDAEKIKVAQIFGNDPVVMGEICKSEYLQKFDIIDINMGCPANKIISNQEGSYLMTDINRAYEIIKSCVNSTSKPITVKFRKGWDDESVNAVEFAKMCERAGASAITVHARTKDQGYSGLSDLDIIKQVKESVTIPVIGNGDVVDRGSFLNMLNYTKCDAVMVGRGAMGKPWVFSEILGKEPKFTTLDAIKEHVNVLKKHYPNNFTVNHMRKHLLWYLKGYKGASEFKAKLLTLTDLNEVLGLIEEFLSNQK